MHLTSKSNFPCFELAHLRFNFKFTKMLYLRRFVLALWWEEKMGRHSIRKNVNKHFLWRKIWKYIHRIHCVDKNYSCYCLLFTVFKIDAFLTQITLSISLLIHDLLDLDKADYMQYKYWLVLHEVFNFAWSSKQNLRETRKPRLVCIAFPCLFTLHFPFKTKSEGNEKTSSQSCEVSTAQI